jgi:hypothetical protein
MKYFLLPGGGGLNARTERHDAEGVLQGSERAALQGRGRWWRPAPKEGTSGSSPLQGLAPERGSVRPDHRKAV